MRKRDSYLALLCIAAAFFLFGCSSRTANVTPPTSERAFNPGKIEKIAVLITQGQVIKDRRLKIPERLLEDEFIKALLAKGYRVPSRSDIKQLTNEPDYQRSALSDPDAAKIGKALNVPAVLIVSVTHFSTAKETHDFKASNELNATLSARLISVERVEVLWINSLSGSGESKNVGILMESLARQVADSFPARN
jgi:hypothetical protein